MKNRMIVFLLIFMVAIIGLNIYLANRISWFFSFGSPTILYILLPILTILLFVSMMSQINSITSMGHIIFGISAIAIGFLLYLLISTIAVDLLNLFTTFRPLTYGLIAFSLAAIISVYGIWNATNIVVNEVNIELTHLQKPIKAAHLTDTHIGHFRGAGNLQKIVDIINTRNADVVFFTGDLMDSKIQLKAESIAPLKNLDAPVFFVEGNHDVYTGTDSIKEYLRNIGVTVLTNEIKNWNGLQIIGLDHMVADKKSVSPHASSNGPTIKNTLNNMNITKELPTILLHHSPDGIKYAEEYGIDLYLAGHTHGGQLWPITHIAELMFEVNKGLHTFNNTQAHVSQGTGTFGPPMRVGTESEISILNLNPIK